MSHRLNLLYKANLWRLQVKTQSKTILGITLLPFHLFVFTCPIALATLQNIPVQAQSSGATQRGYNLLKKGWVDDAITAFEQALKSNPQSLQAKLGLAIAYNRAGRIEAAFQAYQQVLAQDPTNQAALKIVGMMGAYRPEWNKPGIKALNTLLELNPDDLQARYHRALLYSYQGQFSESIADFQIVLANNPSPEAIIGAAQTYSYSGDYQKAKELFNRYQTTGKPITDYAAVAYALTLRKTGNPQGAIEILLSQLRRSQTLDQLGILTRAELAQAYVANKQEAEALAVLDPLQDKEEAILPLARSLNEIRKITNNATLTERITNLYRQSLANNPNPSPTLLREIADVFSGLPQGEETALQLYKRLAATLPNDKSLVLRQLALEYKLAMITKSDVKQRLAATLQNLPTDSVELQQLAVALADLDAPDPQLLPLYQNLLQTGVNVPFLNFRVAQMYLQLDNTVQARQALAEYTATSQGASDMTTQLLAAEIERREGNLEASAQRYFAILTSNPKADIVDGALRGLVGVKVQQKRFEEALVVYEQVLERNPEDITAQLGRTSVAYQAKRISKPEAEAVLNNWLATQKATNTPPELYSLVVQLPTDPSRESLYNYLVEVDSSNIRLQQRLLEVIAQRDPNEARLRMKQLIANAPTNVNSERIALLARAIGDLNMAGKAYENILKEQPDDVDALAALGGIRFEQRRFESAEQIYSTVLEQKPQDEQARRALAGLNAIFDKPLAAMKALEQLQIEQIASGERDPEISNQMQQIQEDFLQRRGFQPPWESYERRGKNR
ncbi:tetratricopeptide repeat protein [Rivularia sp. UHCC 0363]|uniref:tetratricopeptide repeat protein n=1 Tax=Rivularia sp. UHCC 0363 TaxID=3110244 RepID=UPI002B211814|nr:tetratricopeptide repeat protein [Rivularia sp. UHCC 0363]MEA5596662.1 tetratricopeptide repeat protein [Rivularia sp. UHCC 0363]